MDLEFISDKLFDGILVMIRLAPLFMANSLTPMSRMPQTSRVMFMLAIALLIVTSMPSSEFIDWNSQQPFYFFLAMASELLFGVMLMFGFIAAQAAIMTLGRMLEMQIGFGAAGIIDPGTHQSESVIGTMLTLTAVLLMFSFQIDHDIIASLWMSFTVAPVGALLYPNGLEVMVPTLSSQFLLALLLVLPVSLSLLCLDIVIGFLAKTMPQMNIYFVGLPLKIGVGLIVFWLTAPGMLSVFKRIFDEMNAYWLNYVGV